MSTKTKNLPARKGNSMKIMYIDESGDTLTDKDRGKKFFVLVGCVFDEEGLIGTEEVFRKIKTEYFQDPDIEIKSNFIRYANPELSESSILKLKSKKRYDDLERDVSGLLKSAPTTVFSVVISKKDYWEVYPAKDPYETACMHLLEMFEKYLEAENSYGICIIDPREGRMEKHFLGNELNVLHTRMRWENSDMWERCPRIVEKLLFSQSDKTIGIQVADLYSYPIFHVFEYDKKPSEYWRFYECTQLKLFSRDGTYIDIGLKLYPAEKKKDLRFYS